jgi:hypothetical protein
MRSEAEINAVGGSNDCGRRRRLIRSEAQINAVGARINAHRKGIGGRVHNLRLQHNRQFLNIRTCQLLGHVISQLKQAHIGT